MLESLFLIEPADKPGYPHKVTTGVIECHTFKSLTQGAKNSATKTGFALAERGHCEPYA
jgi:hypothetical protein